MDELIIKIRVATKEEIVKKEKPLGWNKFYRITIINKKQGNYTMFVAPNHPVSAIIQTAIINKHVTREK